MKQNLLVAIALFAMSLPLFASHIQDSSISSQQGTVVDVQKHDVESPAQTIGGSNPSDAPLTAQYSVYDVSVRVGCKVYVGRYETPFDYFPSAFAPQKPVDVRPTKHVIYFDLPGKQVWKMTIVHRSAECGS